MNANNISFVGDAFFLTLLIQMSCAEMTHVDVIVPSSPTDCCSLQSFTSLLTEIQLLLFQSLKYRLQILCEFSLIYEELVVVFYSHFLDLVPHK